MTKEGLPESGNGLADETPAGVTSNDETPENKGLLFDEWLANQPPEVKALMEQHVAGLKSALDKERKEVKRLKQERDAEQPNKQRQEQDKPEQDQWKDKHAQAERARQEAEQKLSSLVMRQAFYDAADELKLAFANPQARRDAFRLADLSGVAVEDGKAEGIADVVKAMFKSHPHLFGQATPPPSETDAGKRGGARPGLSEQAVLQKRREYSL